MVASQFPDRAAWPRTQADEREASFLWQPIESQNEWPYLRISRVGSKTSMSGAQRDDVYRPHERRKACGLLGQPRATPYPAC